MSVAIPGDSAPTTSEDSQSSGGAAVTGGRPSRPAAPRTLAIAGSRRAKFGPARQPDHETSAATAAAAASAAQALAGLPAASGATTRLPMTAPSPTPV